jgi:hypothetical protein
LALVVQLAAQGQVALILFLALLHLLVVARVVVLLLQPQQVVQVVAVMEQEQTSLVLLATLQAHLRHKEITGVMARPMLVVVEVALMQLVLMHLLLVLEHRVVRVLLLPSRVHL